MTDTPRYEKDSPHDGEEPRCSFCGRTRHEVKAMFRSDKARICDQCISKMKADNPTPDR